MKKYLMLLFVFLLFVGCSSDDEELVYEYKLVNRSTFEVKAEDLSYIEDMLQPIVGSGYYAQYRVSDNSGLRYYAGDKAYTNDDSLIGFTIDNLAGIVYVLLKEQTDTTIYIENYERLDQYNRDIRGKEYEVIK